MSWMAPDSPYNTTLTTLPAVESPVVPMGSGIRRSSTFEARTPPDCVPLTPLAGMSLALKKSYSTPRVRPVTFKLVLVSLL